MGWMSKVKVFCYYVELIWDFGIVGIGKIKSYWLSGWICFLFISCGFIVFVCSVFDCNFKMLVVYCFFVLLVSNYFNVILLYCINGGVKFDRVWLYCII